jgi:hypothetical protein
MFGCLSLSGCATAPQSVVDKAALGRDVQTALSQVYAGDPSLHAFLAKAYGYAVFPSVGKGAFGFGLRTDPKIGLRVLTRPEWLGCFAKSSGPAGSRLRPRRGFDFRYA